MHHSTEGPFEVVAGRLYRLGGMVGADRRISWLPDGRQGYEPINAYLVLEGSHALLIDTGVAVHGDLIFEQLSALLPTAVTLSIFLTRIEMDCISNLGLIADAFPVASVHAGGASNPFDFFDDLEASSIATKSAELVRIAGDGILPLTNARVLRVVKTKLRLLSTTWLFDEMTGTLFTSDSFGYVGVASAAEAPVSDADDTPSVSEVQEHLTTKFDFLHAADPTEIRAGLGDIFARHRVDAIAPTHGCVLSGAGVVARHVALVDEALASCGKVAA